MFRRLLAFALAVAPLPGVSILDRRWPGLEIEFKASVEPAGSGPEELPGGVLVRPTRVYRLIQDAAHQTYFGYDVIVDSSDGGKTFQVRAEPLSAPSSELTGLNTSWTRLSLPSKPVIPVVRIGATVKLELLVNPASGQKIVDAITVRERNAPNSPPRQFTAADAELRVDKPRLRINGGEIPIDYPGGTMGAAIWFYIADRGRFVVSLEPHAGSQRTGEVTFKRMTIRDGPDVYEVESESAVAPGSGTFFLHVRRDPAWRPGGSAKSAFQLGSADRPEWIR